MSAVLVKEARGLVSDPPKETQMPLRLFSSWLAASWLEPCRRSSAQSSSTAFAVQMLPVLDPGALEA